MQSVAKKVCRKRLRNTGPSLEVGLAAPLFSVLITGKCFRCGPNHKILYQVWENAYCFAVCQSCGSASDSDNEAATPLGNPSHDEGLIRIAHELLDEDRVAGLLIER